MRLLVFFLLVANVVHADPRIGDPAPMLGLPDTKGHDVSLAPGHVSIVDFSATWCGPCHEALDRLVTIANVDLVVVDVNEDADVVRRYYATRALPPGAKVALDVKGDAATRWGHHRYPTTFVVDGAGIIRFINRGYGPGYGERIAQHVSALLPR